MGHRGADNGPRTRIRTLRARDFSFRTHRCGFREARQRTARSAPRLAASRASGAAAAAMARMAGSPVTPPWTGSPAVEEARSRLRVSLQARLRPARAPPLAPACAQPSRASPPLPVSPVTLLGGARGGGRRPAGARGVGEHRAGAAGRVQPGSVCAGPGRLSAARPDTGLSARPLAPGRQQRAWREFRGTRPSRGRPPRAAAVQQRERARRSRPYKTRFVQLTRVSLLRKNSDVTQSRL